MNWTLQVINYLKWEVTLRWGLNWVLNRTLSMYSHFVWYWNIFVECKNILWQSVGQTFVIELKESYFIQKSIGKFALDMLHFC